MIFLYCVAQHDSSCNRLKSRSSLNSSWRIMMLQSKLLNNALCQASQQEASCTTKLALANPIISNFQRGPCCIDPGKVRHVSFLFIIRMQFYSQFTFLVTLLAFYIKKKCPWLQYFPTKRNASSELEVTFISLLSCWAKVIMEIL